MVRPEGVEPPTYWFVASCSIQLSYGRTFAANATYVSDSGGIVGLRATDAVAVEDEDGAPGRTRTSDPLVRSQMLYPAELRAHEKLIELKLR